MKKIPPKATLAVKLPMGVKIAYAACNLAKTTNTILIVAFLLFFYTDVCGIDPKIAATIVLIAKIWDIINDPMMGAIVDKTKSKEGKCRLWLKYFSVPTAVLTVLVFIMPELTETGKIVWVAVTYLLQGMCATAVLIPINTLMGRLTLDNGERTQISQISTAFSCIAKLFATGYAMKIVMATGQGDMKKGFLCLAVIYVASILATYFGTRGYEPVEETANTGETKEKISGGQIVDALVHNKVWLACISMDFLVNMAMAIESGALTYYLTYNIKNLDLMTSYSWLSTVGAVVIGVILLKQFTKRLGNAGSALLGTLLAIAGMLFRFIAHDASSVVILIGWGIVGIGCGLFSGVAFLNIFDAKTYGEWKTGVSNDAVLMAGYSVSYKTGQALATPLIGFLLGMTPYVAGAESQAESVLNMFFYQNTLIPMVCFGLAALCALVLLKNQKNMPMILKELEERNRKVVEHEN